MPIDSSYFLCAGMGTRMGEVGKMIPKPLFPFFDSTLLTTAIEFTKDISKHHFINTHHQSERITSYVESNHSDIRLLDESVLLGVGGAIHNLKKCFPKLNSTYIVNTDLFFIFNKELIKEAVDLLESNTAVLLGVPVKAGGGQNKIEISKDGKLTSIEKGDQRKDYITYSGNSLINLERLKYRAGPSDFFESVALFKEEDVHVLVPDEYKFFDFGTTARYMDSMFEIISLANSNPDDAFIKFCFENKLISSEKISPNSYSSSIENLLNFSGSETKLNGNGEKLIVLEDSSLSFKGPGIYSSDCFSSYEG